MKRRVIAAAFAAFFSFFLTAADAQATIDDAIMRSVAHSVLRNKAATFYSNPEARLELARFHYDAGNKIQAFYLAEKVRTTRGMESSFQPAFMKVAAIPFATLKTPWMDAEKIYQNTRCVDLAAELDKLICSAVRELPAAVAELPADDAGRRKAMHRAAIEVAAAYYRRTEPDKALPLYIDLYFSAADDPPSMRQATIRSVMSITSSQKAMWWKLRLSDLGSEEQVFKQEANPRVLDAGLEQARKSKDAKWVPAMLVALNNDDFWVQGYALHFFAENPSLMPPGLIDEMLRGPDLVKRAMAAFLVVKVLGPDHYGRLKELLDSDVELAQIDAIQALAGVEGSAGIQFLVANRPTHMSAAVEEVWAAALAQRGSK